MDLRVFVLAQEEVVKPILAMEGDRLPVRCAGFLQACRSDLRIRRAKHMQLGL
jgi:hypothetical protein